MTQLKLKDIPWIISNIIFYPIHYLNWKKSREILNKEADKIKKSWNLESANLLTKRSLCSKCNYHWSKFLIEN